MEANFFTIKREYFLFLLPFYFVFHGFAENYVSVAVSEIFVLIGEYLLATLFFLLVFYFVFRSWRKTALYVFALMAFHFFFGAMHDGVKKLFPNAFFVKYTFILPFALVFFIALAILIYRSNRKFNKLIPFLNWMLIIFILIDIPLLIRNISDAGKAAVLSKEFSKCDTCSKPDIYLIIADEYAGHQELKDIFHFDNSPFEDFLQSKGFHIIRNSKSNYNYTPFSMSSMLSMKFLQGIEGRSSSKNDINVCYGLINRNNLWNFFTANGYKIKNYSIFNIDDIPTDAPQNLIVLGTRLITSQTFLSRIDRDVRFNLVTRFKITSEISRVSNYVKKCNRKLYANLLEESKKSCSDPRFIYTHLMMPHYPYYYDSSGKEYPLEFLTEGNQVRKSHYISYLQYCNKKYMQLINAVLNNIKKPSIILFMGDHGWRHFTDTTDHKYYFMNLSSIYLPDKNYGAFYDGMSNVNMFRILLNTQFHQHLPLLKDSTIFLGD